MLLLLSVKSITGAMNTIKPPVSLANPDNEHRVDYIQNVASQPDYEITPVSVVQFYSLVHSLLFMPSPAVSC